MKNDRRVEPWQWVGGIEASVIFAASLAWLAVTMPSCKTLNPADWTPPAITNAVPIPVPTTTTIPPAQGALVDDIDLSTVVWHDGDIRGWSIAADLKAYVRGSQMMLETDLLKGAPELSGKKPTQGNAWTIALCRDGRWHAATYEWLSHSRQSRDAWKATDRKPSGGGGHINHSAFDGVEVFPGTVIYQAVSGPARDSRRTVQIRTPFRKVVLP